MNLKQMIDMSYRRYVEYFSGKIEKIGYSKLVPDELRTPGKYRKKEGSGMFMELFDVIRLDDRGRKAICINQTAVKCRNIKKMGNLYAVFDGYCSIPITICKKCEFYEKTSKGKYRYPTCRFVKKENPEKEAAVKAAELFTYSLNEAVKFNHEMGE